MLCSQRIRTTVVNDCLIYCHLQCLHDNRCRCGAFSFSHIVRVLFLIGSDLHFAISRAVSSQKITHCVCDELYFMTGHSNRQPFSQLFVQLAATVNMQSFWRAKAIVKLALYNLEYVARFTANGRFVIFDISFPINLIVTYLRHKPL